jgi:hypothetical protein
MDILNKLLNPEILAGGIIGILFTLIVFYLVPMCCRWVYFKFFTSGILEGKWIHYYFTYDQSNNIVLYSSKIDITFGLRNDFDVISYNQNNEIMAKGKLKKDTNNTYLMSLKAVHHSDTSYITFHEPRWNNNDVYFLGFSLSHDTNQILISGVSIFSKEPFDSPEDKIKDILANQVSINSSYKIIKNSKKNR